MTRLAVRAAAGGLLWGAGFIAAMYAGVWLHDRWPAFWVVGIAVGALYLVLRLALALADADAEIGSALADLEQPDWDAMLRIDPDYATEAIKRGDL